MINKLINSYFYVIVLFIGLMLVFACTVSLAVAGSTTTEQMMNKNIAIVKLDASPIVKSGYKNTVIVFKAVDFVNYFRNFYETDLVKIKIISLPNDGVLSLYEKNVDIDQEILVNDLDNLVFVPSANQFENNSFSWSGSSGEVYEADVASVFITIFPIISTITKNTYGNPVGFGASDFIRDFNSSLSCHNLKKIKITSLPVHGKLQINNIPISKNYVADNQEIAVEDLDNLAFIPDADWGGVDSFMWQGCDDNVCSHTIQTNIAITTSWKVAIASASIAAITATTIIGTVLFCKLHRHRCKPLTRRFTSSVAKKGNVRLRRKQIVKMV